jgi:outer membrane protein TolC
LAVSTEDGPASLLVRRPDIVAAESRLAAADARITEAVTAYYPRLTIQGLVGFLSSGLSGLLSDDALQAAGSAGLSGRLFDFGAARGGVDIARGRTREAAAAYRLTVLRAASEAEDGFSRLSRSNRHAQELEQSQASAARASTTARTAYDLGGLSLKDALDVQRRLLEVEDSAATARADAARASVSLFRVLGGGWSADTSVQTRLA